MLHSVLLRKRPRGTAPHCLRGFIFLTSSGRSPVSCYLFGQKLDWEQYGVENEIMTHFKDSQSKYLNLLLLPCTGKPIDAERYRNN